MSAMALATSGDRKRLFAARLRRHRRRPWGLFTVCAATLVFLFLPIAIVALYSFNSTRSLASFSGLSLRWYRVAFADHSAWSSVLLSAEIGITVAAVAAVVGTLLAIGIERGRGQIARPVEAVMVLSVIAPEIATAIALLLLFTGLGISLSPATIIIGHVTFAIPYVGVVVGSRLVGLDPAIEEAAADLGATRLQTLRLVVIPQLLPAIAGAALLVFLISFDDFVTSFFMSGLGTQPLPLFIYSLIRVGVSPEINAIGTLLIAVTAVLGITGYALVSVKSDRVGS
jgi:spermidine/putrescine transport system permease protein